MDKKLAVLLGVLDEFQYRFSCGMKLLETVHECMESGVHDVKTYTDALFGAYMYLSDMSDELAEIVRDQYEEGTR